LTRAAKHISREPATRRPTDQATRTLRIPDRTSPVAVTGPAEKHLKLVREALGVGITARDGSLKLRGKEPAVRRATGVVQAMIDAARDGQPMDRSAVLEAVAAADTGPVREADPVMHEDGETDRPIDPASLRVYLSSRPVQPQTAGQHAYLEAIHEHDLTLCIGPAGTGKTYLAVAAAVSMLRRGAVRKLVLARPAVEAGEKLGFLPGTMQDKVNPYLRPLLDALHDMMSFDQVQRFMAVDVIEIVPLAFMRGRTLNDAMIILDEAQNTTRSQMLMFLTRMGHGSKCVVTGDASQIDLDDPRDSGLVDAARRLGRVRGVGMISLGGSDIVRHSLVQRIVQAYGQTPDRRPQQLPPDGAADDGN
jgi:phosphate starvation-inducible PhoH-like protein